MNESAATRLCAACGMCCNGVMFHRVRLQSRDSDQTLSALGLSVTGKKKNRSIIQPCPAHQGSGCSIYHHRPGRCRSFVCQLLLNVEAQILSEAQARECIVDGQTLVRQLRELFRQAGETDNTKSFVVRFSTILGQPISPRSDPRSQQFRQQLIDCYAQLEEHLKRHFRLPEKEPKPITSAPQLPLGACQS